MELKSSTKNIKTALSMWLDDTGTDPIIISISKNKFSLSVDRIDNDLAPTKKEEE